MDNLFADVQAVLFDVDGTVLNTFEFIYQSFEFALSQHGAPPRSRSEISHFMGSALEKCYAELAPDQDSVLLSNCHRDFQAKNVHLATVFPATMEVLQHLRKSGRKLAAVTSRSLRSSIISMKAVGIADFFDVILSAEDVTRLKPDPEPVRRALELLKISPENAVMIGDTSADILAGSAAGTRTIGALYGFAGEYLREQTPDAFITDLHDLIELLP